MPGNAGRDPCDVDLLVVGTFTPDMRFPSTGNLVQDRLKLNCPAFDIQAACAGFVFALVTAAQFVGRETSRGALVIGGDCNSRVINPTTRRASPSSATAPVRSCLAPGARTRTGRLSARLGRVRRRPLSRPACGSRIPPTAEPSSKGLHYLTMDGRAVFKWAVRILTDSTLAVLTTPCKVADIRWFIPHQANVRIIHAASDVLGFHRDAVFKNLENGTATPPPARSRSRSTKLIRQRRNPNAATSS